MFEASWEITENHKEKDLWRNLSVLDEYKSILREYDLLEFWNPDILRQKSATFCQKYKQKISEKFLLLESDRIKSSKSAKFLLSKIKIDQFIFCKSPFNSIPINHKATKWILRMLSGNLPFTWRNSEDQRMHPSCCLCGEKWKSYEHIVLHITKYCSQVNIRPINFCEIDKFLRD